MQITAELAEGVILKGERDAVNDVLDMIEGDEVDLVIMKDVNLKVEIDGGKWWKDATYSSQSKGRDLSITEMPTTHIANAAAKIMHSSAIGLFRFNSEMLFVMLQDDELRALLSELCERVERENA